MRTNYKSLGSEDPRYEFFADPDIIDKKFINGYNIRSLHGDSLFMELLILFINLLLVSNKTFIFPDTFSVFADPSYRYVMTPPPQTL